MGLAGCGGVARQFHLPALLADPRAELVAVADPSPEARAAAAEAADAEILADPAELVRREDVEAVVVCAPPAAHAEIAEEVVAAGRHLYLEKPVGLDQARARRLADVDTGGAVAALGFEFRFNPAFARLRDRVSAGDIGPVRSARCVHNEAGLHAAAPGWKTSRATGGGVALDLVSHSIDTARWLLGDEVAAVERASIESRSSECDELSAVMRMRGGASIELMSSYLRGRGHRWELNGEGGTLVADRWPRLVRRSRRRGHRIGRVHKGLLAIPLPRREPSFALALGRFLAACRGEDRGPLATIEDGVRSLEAVLEIEREAALESLPT